VLLAFGVAHLHFLMAGWDADVSGGAKRLMISRLKTVTTHLLSFRTSPGGYHLLEVGLSEHLLFCSDTGRRQMEVFNMDSGLDKYLVMPF
jgi:hypothetical protein